MVRTSRWPSCNIGDFPQAPPISRRAGIIWGPERCRRFRATEHANRLFAAADLGAAAGGIQVERSQLLI